MKKKPKSQASKMRQLRAYLKLTLQDRDYWRSEHDKIARKYADLKAETRGPILAPISNESLAERDAEIAKRKEGEANSAKARKELLKAHAAKAKALEKTLPKRLRTPASYRCSEFTIT